MSFMPKSLHPYFALKIVNKTCFHFHRAFLNKDLSCDMKWMSRINWFTKTKGCGQVNVISPVPVSVWILSLTSIDKLVKARTLQTQKSSIESCPRWMELVLFSIAIMLLTLHDKLPQENRNYSVKSFFFYHWMKRLIKS